MSINDYIIIAIAVIMHFFAFRFIWKSIKSGERCIGCPDSAICTRNAPRAFERELNEECDEEHGSRSESEEGE